MKAVIRKWGNSPALRLSVSIIKGAYFSLEQQVNIVAAKRRIVIAPLETGDVVGLEFDP